MLAPESNVQFGEGGAGTFSDGKLYSGIKDPRHLGRKVLTEFVKAGAPEEILYVSKPHIGTFRLVTMVESIRAQIEALGGEYRFGTKVVDLVIEADAAGQRRIRGVVLEDGETMAADHVVLAIGHSARDTFEMLRDRGVYLEAEALQHRRPHRASAVDDRPRPLRPECRQPAAGRGRLQAGAPLPANGRSVYSFCMCPGGRVVAATSEPGRVVTNGMSQYSPGRAQRQCRHRRRHLARRTTRATCWPASNSSGTGRAWPSKPAAATTAPRRSWSATSSRDAPSTALGDVVPSYQPGRRRRPTWRAACRISPWRRCARRCWRSTARSPASPAPMR